MDFSDATPDTTAETSFPLYRIFFLLVIGGLGIFVAVSFTNLESARFGLRSAELEKDITERTLLAYMLPQLPSGNEVPIKARSSFDSYLNWLVDSGKIELPTAEKLKKLAVAKKLTWTSEGWSVSEDATKQQAESGKR